MDLEVGGGARLRAGRVFCIGRNYVAHAAELGNEVPESPVVFLKPATCLVANGAAVHLPRHGRELHHEAELVVVIGREGRAASDAEAPAFVAALGLGLDLTLRDVQSELKARSLPWEKAKAFEESAPLGPLVEAAGHDLTALRFECRVNGSVRQRGDTALMLFPVARILVELSAIWTLRPGDLIYTGTPAGVGPLVAGDRIELEGAGLAPAAWTIVAAA